MTHKTDLSDLTWPIQVSIEDEGCLNCWDGIKQFGTFLEAIDVLKKIDANKWEATLHAICCKKCKHEGFFVARKKRFAIHAHEGVFVE